MAEREHDADLTREPARRVRQPDATGPARGGLLELAAGIGNAAFARLARHGAGLLPGGRVHRDVEDAIAARHGSGRALDPATRERIGGPLGDTLEDVRVHDDPGAAGLARAVSARAFTTGADVYFGTGEYRPGTSDGDRLLAHELTHVVQQRAAPSSGPLTVSEPGDPLEQEADAATGDILGH
jgi:hypothetical protein